jgi:hypothetical protein
MSCSAPPRLAFALALLLASAPLLAQSAADPLTDRLIRLRSEVEQVNSELELLREEQRTTLAGLAAQRAELSASVDRQQLAAREAQRKLDEANARVAEAGASGDGLRPLLDAAVDGLVAQVAAGLPFKREERLAELEAFRTQVGNGSLPPARAVNRLWAFFEDEFRLTRENSLQSQTIELDGERLLADVAKLGSMVLYFRTQDGRVGQAVSSDGGWRFVSTDDATAQRQIRGLFDALRKQIRQGYFELPLAAVAGPR